MIPRRHQAAALLTAAIALAGCGGSSTPAAGTQPLTTKYTQTWKTPYKDTTCEQWLGDMTGSQQFSASADMLTGARNQIDGGTGLPPDSLVISFQADVSEACSAEVDGLKLTDVAAGIYMVGRKQYGP